MGFRQCLPLNVVLLKGKHCRNGSRYVRALRATVVIKQLWTSYKINEHACLVFWNLFPPYFISHVPNDNIHPYLFIMELKVKSVQSNPTCEMVTREDCSQKHLQYCRYQTTYLIRFPLIQFIFFINKCILASKNISVTCECYFVNDFNPASEAVETAAAIEVVAETERKDDDKD